MRPLSQAGNSGQRASALVMVILVLAGMLTAVFGTQRLVLVQYNQATSEEDNLLALYAAKAGIEDGLIRFRHQRNVETERDATETKVHRFNLTNGENLGEILENSGLNGLTPNHQYYDLKINYRGLQVGNFSNLDGSPPLAKDEVLELSGFPAGQYFLRLSLKFINCQGNQSGIGQVETIKKDGGGNRIFDSDTLRPTNNLYDSAGGQLTVKGRQNQPISDQFETTTIFRLRALHCDLRYALATSKTSSGSGANPDAGPEFDTGTTTLTATGYYGRAKHTLVGRIDRTSGRLLGIFDFNVFAGGDILPK